MNAIEFRLDYFQLYNLEQPVNLASRPLAARTAELKGQFDKVPERYRLEWLFGFADRASKNGEKLYDPNAHLTCYAVRGPTNIQPIRRHVLVANQFGKEQELEIREVFALMVPCVKRIRPQGPSSERTKLDHYNVYRVTQGRPVEGPPIKLADQFDTRETRVYKPYAFAVPVWKKHGNEEFPILNPAHLTIYWVDSSRDVPTEIDTLDQFFTHRFLKLGVSQLLAVPSKKLRW